MSNHLPAKPTEYRGTVFKTKSAAVFARCLDRSPLVHKWKYKPKDHSHDWTFSVLAKRRVSRTFKGFGSVSWHGIQPILVDYKPNPPTQRYVDKLTEKVRPSAEAAIEKWDSYIVWGNPWAGPVVYDRSSAYGPCSYVAYPVFSNEGRYGWGNFIQLGDNGEDVLFSHQHYFFDIFGVSENMAQEARRYCFDLKQGECEYE